jgi:polyisoprenyl-phosphate glycosyltransferase
VTAVTELRSLAFVVPAFGEAACLPSLLPRLLAQAPLAAELQVLIVDDHSGDATFDVVREWAARDRRVQGLRLARNSGSHVAILCGLSAARSDAVVVLAADGQDPPELAGRLVEAWKAGAHVVWAVRESREGESLLTRLLSRAYYRLMNSWSSVQLPSSGADFLLMDRRVVEAVLTIPERNTSLFALIASLGFRQAEVPYTKQSREAGRSKWSFSSKLRLLVDSLAAFSTVPLRLATALGVVYASAGFVYAGLIVVNRISGGVLFGATPLTGWSALMVALLISSGTTMLMLGIFGEYLWRVLEQVRGRPRFLVEDSVNLPRER